MNDRNTFLNLVGTAFATFTGVLGSIAVAYFTFLNSDRGHDIRMVEIGLSILRGEGDKETSLPARKFALDMVEKFSGVEISSSDADTWARTGTTPFRMTGWFTDSFQTAVPPNSACAGLQEREQVNCLVDEFIKTKRFYDALGDIGRAEQP